MPVSTKALLKYALNVYNAGVHGQRAVRSLEQVHPGDLVLDSLSKVVQLIPQTPYHMKHGMGSFLVFLIFLI